MRLQLTLGSETPRRGGLVAPLVKLTVVAALAFVVMNRSDIRRYLRLRRM
jgi:uncharacterized protein DUF6893